MSRLCRRTHRIDNETALAGRTFARRLVAPVLHRKVHWLLSGPSLPAQ